MNKKRGFLILLLAAGLGLAAFLLLRENTWLPMQDSDRSNTASARPTSAKDLGNTPEAPAIAPVKAQTPTATAERPSTQPRTSTPKGRVTDLVASSNDLRELYQQLAKSQDPRQLYAAAAILDNCAYTSQRGWLRQNDAVRIVGPNAELRQQLVEELKPGSVATRCRSYANEPPTREQIRAAYEKSAEAGDALAQIWKIEDQIRANAAKIDPKVFAKATSVAIPESYFPQSLPQQSFDTAVRTLMKGDADSILAAGPLLTAAYQETQVTLGGQPLTFNLSSDEFWLSVSCARSQSCTFAEMRELKNACIVEHACDAPDYDAFLRQYRMRAEDWQQFQRTRDQVVEAIRTQNSALFQIRQADPSKGVVPSGTMMTRVDRPRTRLTY